MSIAILIAAVVLFFLSIWVVVPAPTMALLPLGVGGPELSPVLLPIAVVVAGMAWRFGATPYNWALALALAAAALFAVPIVQFMRMPDAPPFSPRRLLFGWPQEDVRVARDIRFAAPEGVPLTMDIYRPAAAGRYPSVVQIYGGAWQRGAPRDNAGLARHLAARGFVVFAIDYRHAPRWQWPAQQDDVRAAIAWVRTHAEDHGADASRLALLGRSAGGQLALTEAFQDPGVSAVVSFYGPVNLTEGWLEPPTPDPIDSRAVLEAYLGGTPAQVPDRYRAASPISHVSARAPRTLLLYGSRDHIVQARFGRQLHQQLLAAGAPSRLIELPWAEHAFDVVEHGLGGQLSRHHVERFLSDALK